MKNVVLVALVLIVLVLIIFRMKSSADPVTPPVPTPAVVGPRSGQQWYFVAAAAPCPDGYSKPDPSNKPTICKLNNS